MEVLFIFSGHSACETLRLYVCSLRLLPALPSCTELIPVPRLMMRLAASVLLALCSVARLLLLPHCCRIYCIRMTFFITAVVVVQKAVSPRVFNLKVSEVACTYLSFPVMFCLFPASSSRDTKQVAGIHSFKKLGKLCAVISGALCLAAAT